MESNLFHSLNKTQPKKVKLSSETQQQKQPKKVSFEDEEFDEQEQELMREINKGLAASMPARVNSSPPPSSKPQQDTTTTTTTKNTTKSSVCTTVLYIIGADYVARKSGYTES